MVADLGFKFFADKLREIAIDVTNNGTPAQVGMTPLQYRTLALTFEGMDKVAELAIVLRKQDKFAKVFNELVEKNTNCAKAFEEACACLDKIIEQAETWDV